MTKENAQLVENTNVENIESGLDDALAILRSEKDRSSDIMIDEPKREILKLPKKSEVKEVESEPEIEQEENFDPREFVEIDNPKFQKKVNYLYKQVKGGEETNALLRDELRKVTNSSEFIYQQNMELMRRLGDIENRSSKQDEDSLFSNLRNQYKEAISNFEYDKASEINEKIVDFKTQQKLNEVIKAQNVAEFNRQQQERQKKGPEFYSDPQDDIDAKKFISEKTSDGSLVRPWLNPNHPESQDVIDMMAAISNKYIRKGQKPTISLVMKEMDQYKGVNSNQGISKDTSIKYAPVLSGNNTGGIPSDNQDIKLTDLERSFASKMGISDKEYAKVKKFSSSGPISVESFSRK